jgi:hypothetical protein
MKMPRLRIALPLFATGPNTRNYADAFSGSEVGTVKAQEELLTNFLNSLPVQT